MHVPDRQLDPPYPGDETEAEWEDRRVLMLAELGNDQIVDMLLDEPRLGSILYTGIVHPFSYKRPPSEADREFLYRRLWQIMKPKLERYLEANE